ncbi:efflux RND transporter periplasmic adaptor subunit [Massilia forsythiae]|uniref:Efflux RND transporter periplasmic adaptor subunit n=1 Tax=Massilia forsythiae TaxID=2728020 RepID=A0A7Z2ZSX7_9BURK|nr:efflux RND transporter periplasmic adaptor subunit [Massilia forsythiae]QJE00988.1 efflux RND transporter periplasmic adaptor subunit [Massilia forsythiae]
MRPVHSPSLSLSRIAACTLTAIALLSACGNKDAAPGAAGAPGGKMPPPQVGVITTKFQQVALETELPARVEAIRVAEVRARVNGVVLKRTFTEGSIVKQGQSLFQIDPDPYQAQVNASQAALGRAQANLTSTAAIVNRYKPLVEANAVSQQEYTNAVASQKQAEADVSSARAQLKISQINLAFANVYAPISGRIGRALVTEGALVSATEATQLALIQQTDSVYLNITQSASELQRLRKNAGGKGIDSALPVTVVMDDGSVLPRKGKLLFSDVTVDQTSGQITLRAQIANPDSALLPGQYVRVRLAQAELPSGILVPQQAVTRGGQTGDTVMVVGADNKPAQRTVKIASQEGASWVITDGLKEGEKVMVDGFQKLQMMPPGTPVQPVAWTPAANPNAPAAAGNPAAQPNAAGAEANAAAAGKRVPNAGSPAAGAAAGPGNTRQ